MPSFFFSVVRCEEMRLEGVPGPALNPIIMLDERFLRILPYTSLVFRRWCHFLYIFSNNVNLKQLCGNVMKKSEFDAIPYFKKRYFGLAY